jgi:Tfp pilus assembly protein PilX
MSSLSCDRRPGPSPASRDEGSALIITLMVLALLTALSTTVAVVTINNLQSSQRVQRAGVALNAAEAGVAQAVSYIRSSGVRGLSCWPACGVANPWGDRATPMTVSLPGGTDARYAVHIQPVTALTPTVAGLYRIHSRGTAGTLAARDISVDVAVSTVTAPKGIVARTVSGGGSASVQRASIISTGCVYNRSKIQFGTDLDAAYKIPPAVHSSQIITDSNGSGQYCPTTKKPIHDPSKTGPAKDCATAFPHDQDRLGGGDLGTGACGSVKSTYPTFYGQRTDVDTDADVDVDGSYIQDDSTLLSLFGIRTPVLTQAELDQLRTIAKSQDNYHRTAAPPAGGVWAPDENHAVLFFDLAQDDPGGVVDLDSIDGFGRDPEPTVCPDKSLIVVIEGGNARLNANRQLVASVFLTSSAPYGQLLKASGTADFIGSIYADSVDLTGNIDVSMDECFVNNLSPALLSLSTSNYVEVDR